MSHHQFQASQAGPAKGCEGVMCCAGAVHVLESSTEETRQDQQAMTSQFQRERITSEFLSFVLDWRGSV